MKKITFLFVTLLLLLCLSACSASQQYENPLQFYYQSQYYNYEADCSALEAETREGADFTSLEDALSHYLQGPKEGNLVNPFPAGTRLISIRQEGNTFYITLSNQLANLKGLKLTIACCCIAATCLELTDATNICIQAESAPLNGESSITLNRDTINLLDKSQ